MAPAWQADLEARSISPTLSPSLRVIAHGWRLGCERFPGQSKSVAANCAISARPLFDVRASRTGQPFAGAGRREVIEEQLGTGPPATWPWNGTAQQAC